MDSESSARPSWQGSFLRLLGVVAAIGFSVVGLTLGWVVMFWSVDLPAYPTSPLFLLGALGVSCYFVRSKWWLIGPAAGATLGAAAGLTLIVVGGYVLTGF